MRGSCWRNDKISSITRPSVAGSRSVARAIGFVSPRMLLEFAHLAWRRRRSWHGPSLGGRARAASRPWARVRVLRSGGPPLWLGATGPAASAPPMAQPGWRSRVRLRLCQVSVTSTVSGDMHASDHVGRMRGALRVAPSKHSLPVVLVSKSAALVSNLCLCACLCVSGRT